LTIVRLGIFRSLYYQYSRIHNGHLTKHWDTCCAVYQIDPYFGGLLTKRVLDTLLAPNTLGRFGRLPFRDAVDTVT